MKKNPIFEELFALYAETDQLFSSWSCPASTTCCRFGITGREPHVTNIELAVVLDAARRAGVSLDAKTPSKKALPLLSEGRCPFLSNEGSCSIYASRPFGCRTFFCDDATPGERVRHREITDLSRRIEALSQRFDGRHEKGRPLTKAIFAAQNERSAAPGKGRR